MVCTPLTFQAKKAFNYGELLNSIQHKMFHHHFYISPINGKMGLLSYIWGSKNNSVMSVMAVVVALFVLAIVSPWIFPNKMVSNNEHDIKH